MERGHQGIVDLEIIGNISAKAVPTRMEFKVNGWSFREAQEELCHISLTTRAQTSPGAINHQKPQAASGERRPRVRLKLKQRRHDRRKWLDGHPTTLPS